MELGLDTLRALDRVHDGGKVYQKGIANSFNDRAMMLPDRAPDDLDMDIQQPQHTRFIGAHLTAETHDVVKHDRGQAAGLGVPYTSAVLWHGGNYPACSMGLSNKKE